MEVPAGIVFYCCFLLFDEEKKIESAVYFFPCYIYFWLKEQQFVFVAAVQPIDFMKKHRQNNLRLVFISVPGVTFFISIV